MLDEIDFAISFVLLGNSRIPYRDLAEIFNMSVNSIHKRIKKLVDLEIIREFQTHLSGVALPFINVVMFGNSNEKDMEEVINKLGAHEYIYNVTQASVNYLYIHARIRNLNELESLISFIRKVGEIEDLTVGLDAQSPLNFVKEPDLSFTQLDYQIVNVLKDNSRKLISEIAAELGVSTKTVKRRLDRLIEEKLIEFTIDWRPDKTGIISSLVHLKLDEGVDKNKLEAELRQKHGSNLIFIWTFSNIPELMLVLFLTKAMNELQELESSLKADNFKDVTVTLLLRGDNFPTWREKYLETQIEKL